MAAPPTEIEKQVSELEIAVDRVRSLYEQYFMGIEKLEPTVPRKDVDRKIHLLRKEQIRNTAQRFRFQMILQRYNTYQTHWQRICREIEGGTYKRHVIRAQQRFGDGTAAGRRRASKLPPPSEALSRTLAEELAELDREFAPAAELDDMDVELIDEPPPPQASVAPRPAPSAARPQVPATPGPTWRKASLAPPAAPPPPPRPTTGPSVPPTRVPQATSAKMPPATPVARPPMASPAAPRPAPAAPGDLSDDRVRALYAQYVEAKRRQNESTATITYDAVAKSLRDSSAKLHQKHGKPVDFEVTVKDGKAILKPVLK